MSDSFYLGSAVDVAPKLVGAHIRMGDIELEILETEAYMPDDSACHAHKKDRHLEPCRCLIEEGRFMYIYAMEYMFC